MTTRTFAGVIGGRIRMKYHALGHSLKYRTSVLTKKRG
jgi:hypothetical protein